MKYWSLLLVGLMIVCAGCFRPKHSVMEVRVPEMKSEECWRIIENALNAELGSFITEKQPDIPNRLVVFTYQNESLGERNIEKVIASAGFDANSTMADPEAKKKLPEGCR